jgi:hypothetical protein
LLSGAQAVEVAARSPDGGTQALLLLKDILPDWPTPYIFKEPVLFLKGTELVVTSYYVNPGDEPQPGGVKLTVARYEPVKKPVRSVRLQADLFERLVRLKPDTTYNWR